MSDAITNAPEYSVSELAFALKKTVEQTYGRVRVRGELGRVTIAKSGHCYLDIKDDKAVINSIMWAGVVSRLPMRPEEGMEVIVEGKMSTYPGRSNYQLIIDRMEPAGEGALMALLEKRKKALAAEGLFDDARKQDLPFIPQTIGVVTSPTGAVIRDILHRIEDRFPAHVILWPVLVQGEKAAAQIAYAINGFNKMPPAGSEGLRPGDPVRPDVLIVGRGGGSLEDLWCFNEENVARAAANSDIPLISAVGHETDWTIIDYIADYRAPTPTGAAEVAVPVRADLLATTEDYQARLRRALTRSAEQARLTLSAARLPRPDSLLQPLQQRFDSARLPRIENLLERPAQKLSVLSARMPALSVLTRPLSDRAAALAARLTPALRNLTGRKSDALSSVSGRLSPARIQLDQDRMSERLTVAARGQSAAMARRLETQTARLERAASLLSAYSYQGVLERGFALVRDEAGKVVRDGSALSSGQSVSLTFKDDVTRKAVIDGNPADMPPAAPPAAPKAKKPAAKRPKKNTDKTAPPPQLGLF